jgi:hypothetical protein
LGYRIERYAPIRERYAYVKTLFETGRGQYGQEIRVYNRPAYPSPFSPYVVIIFVLEEELTLCTIVRLIVIAMSHGLLHVFYSYSLVKLL